MDLVHLKDCLCCQRAQEIIEMLDDEIRQLENELYELEQSGWNNLSLADRDKLIKDAMK